MKYRYLSSLLILVSLWSFVYAAIKYFFWGVFSDTSFSPSLEMISGYELLGGVIAYIVGGTFYSSFRRSYVLFGVAIFAVLSFVFGYMFGGSGELILAVTMIGSGFTYGMYVIAKNTLVSQEIHETKISDTIVGGLVTILFIALLIFGTIAGAKLGEIHHLHQIGMITLIALLIAAGGISFFVRPKSECISIDSSKEKLSIRSSLSQYYAIFCRYALLLVSLSILWQVSAEFSQLSIAYSVREFARSNAESSLLLLFSSVGAIIGNIASMKLAKSRIRAISILGGLFFSIILLSVWLFPYANRIDNYSIIQTIAFFLGLFFGALINLIESYFFALLGNDLSCEYGAAAYGLVLSFMGVGIMFLSHTILSFSNMNIAFVIFFLAILTIGAVIGSIHSLCTKNLLSVKK
ncbi:hypothetical protein KBD33_04945 [Candidatus Gracilibacteria bacterium]|nr:hypothetical protein [Candidatus Gracilibacteria bacterium]